MSESRRSVVISCKISVNTPENYSSCAFARHKNRSHKYHWQIVLVASEHPTVVINKLEFSLAVLGSVCCISGDNIPLFWFLLQGSGFVQFKHLTILTLCYAERVVSTTKNTLCVSPPNGSMWLCLQYNFLVLVNNN